MPRSVCRPDGLDSMLVISIYVHMTRRQRWLIQAALTAIDEVMEKMQTEARDEIL